MSVTIDWNLLDTWGQVQDWFEKKGWQPQYTGPELPTDPIMLWRYLDSLRKGSRPT